MQGVFQRDLTSCPCPTKSRNVGTCVLAWKMETVVGGCEDHRLATSSSSPPRAAQSHLGTNTVVWNLSRSVNKERLPPGGGCTIGIG